MQALGLQTVLGMSNAVERVQQTAQMHGAVTADQFKDILEKQNDLKKTEVQNVEQSATEVRIREDMHRNKRQSGQEPERQAKENAEQEASEEKKAAPAVMDETSQGRLLDIKV